METNMVDWKIPLLGLTVGALVVLRLFLIRRGPR
jgi:hypothetical protein